MKEVERLDKIENKVSKLEVDFEREALYHTQILSCLQTIESRLLGSLDSKEPGLITDVENLKTDITQYKADITKLYENITIEVRALKQIVDDLNKNKWLLQGALIIIGVIIGKIDWIYKLVFKNG